MRIATGIAEALEAAHDKGVVHRDLKPGNIKITPACKVKVLDFGLAKALGEAPESQSEFGGTHASTVTLGDTRAGAVIGTAAYMSPEQAEAKATDKRSDVWSFGVVLYEMLSGKRCFDGKSTPHVIVHLLEDEPDWDKLPPSVPSGVRSLLERCLQKDPAKRLRDVRDLRVQLEALAGEASNAYRRVRAAAPRAQAKGLPYRVLQAIAAVAVAAALAMALPHLRSRPPAPAEIARFQIEPPPDTTLISQFTVSPDGRGLVFIPLPIRGGERRLWVRSLGDVEPHPLAGTEGASGIPFWSPDSRFIVFTSGGGLKKIEASGGLVQTLCSTQGALAGGFWTLGNKIIFGVSAPSGLLQVSAAGGTPTPVTTPVGSFLHSHPALLPDGRHFVYTAFSGNPNIDGTYVGSLDAKPDQQQVRKLISSRSRTAFVADPRSKNGHLLFVRGNTLVAQAFDPERLDLSGDAQPIAENISFDGFSVSSNGVLAYLRGGGGGLQQLTWLDQEGQPHGTAGEPFVGGFTSEPALSPDQTRLAFARRESQSGNIDIWINELARNVSTRFTTNPGSDVEPVWSPDGASIIFTGERNGIWGLYRKASNLLGGEELLYKSDHGQPDYVTSWSRDGRYILFQKLANGIFALPVDAPANGERKPIEVVPPGSDARGARFLPDPHYVSYVSDESGQQEIYVQTFDPNPASGSPRTSAGKWRISTGGGISMRWRVDGKRLFYLTSADGNQEDSLRGNTGRSVPIPLYGQMMAVDVTYSPTFHAGVPKRLFPSRSASIFWEMAGDGQQFLIPIAQGQSASAPYTVVLNWNSLLKTTLR